MSAVSTSARLCDLRQVANVSECPLSSKDRVTIKLSPSLTFQKMLESLVSSELLACHLSWLAKNGALQYETLSAEGTTGTTGGVFLLTELSSFLRAVHPTAAPQYSAI